MARDDDILDRDIEALIDGILDREGWPAFSDRPDDRGGPTKGGITLRTLRAWRRDESVPADELRRLSEREARAIYRELYVYQPNFDRIEDDELRLDVIDAGVLHGTYWAAMALQRVAGVAVDMHVGPITLAAVNGADPRRLNILFAAARLRHVVDIVVADAARGRRLEGQLRFLEGWVNRTLAFVEREAGRS